MSHEQIIYQMMDSIKNYNHKKKLLADQEVIYMTKINNDLKLLESLIAEEKTITDFSGFQAYTITGDCMTLSQLIQFKSGLIEAKVLYKEKFGEMQKVLDESQIKMKNEMKNLGMDIHYGTAEVMVNSFNF